jgi:hypothetical protein
MSLNIAYCFVVDEKLENLLKGKEQILESLSSLHVKLGQALLLEGQSMPQQGNDSISDCIGMYIVQLQFPLDKYNIVSNVLTTY